MTDEELARLYDAALKCLAEYAETTTELSAQLASAQADERAKVVEWLLTYPSVIGLSKMAAWNTAAAVEHGDHRRPEQ